MDNLTDWYSLIENGIADRLRAELLLMGYITKDEQVSDNDSVLFKGNDYYAIFRPGPFPVLPIEYETGKIVDVDWNTFIFLYVRYKEKAEQWSTFRPFRNALIQLVMKHRFLKKVYIGDDYPQEFAEVLNIDRIRSISGNDEPGYFMFNGSSAKASPNFMTQRLTVITRQRCKFL